MAPLLVSALVGVGVKIATDLLSAGFKQAFRSEGPASFASTLDKARAATTGNETTGTASTGTSTPPSTPDFGFGDRSRVLAAEASGLPTSGRGYGVASYRRFDEVPQAI